MKKRISAFLSTMISIALYSQQGLTGNLSERCILDIPRYNRPFLQAETNESPTTIIADTAKGNYLESVTFIGDVNITQGNSCLRANKVRLYQKKIECDGKPVRMVDAMGNVSYGDNQIILKGSRAWSNLNTKDINIWEGAYQMVGRQGHGKADLIRQCGGNRYLILENGTFTSCLPGFDSWSMAGSEVVYDREEEIAEIWNARFNLGPIPIFYSPYLRFPVGNKRLSGFLIPNIKYNMTNYFDFCLPYYWNIANNMDLTITPHYIQRLGKFMWESEFRYCSQAGSGSMEVQYLPSNNVFKESELLGKKHHRWMYYWHHAGVMDKVWRFSVDYTKISDPHYFNDSLSKHGASRERSTTQMFSSGYAARNFEATLSRNLFRIFNGKTTSTFGATPKIDVNWYYHDIGPFNLGLFGQAVHFVNSNPDIPETTRIHFEPSVGLPCSNSLGNLNTEVKFLVTYHQQKNLNNSITLNHPAVKKTVKRTLPQFKLDGKLNFERNINLSNRYTQTLEPRIQYLYVPYRDQRKINNYDSSLLQFNYSGLFRERTYSGLDRIASTNQVSIGATSRFFDLNAIERGNVSIGQIYYFSRLRTGDDDWNWNKNNKAGFLILAGDTYLRVSDYWDLRGSMQYDARLNGIATSNASMEYRLNEDHIVTFTYRYGNPEYIQAILARPRMFEEYNQGISQIGGAAFWCIDDHWSLLGTHYFDTNTHKMADQKLRLQYNSCCYALRVGYERKLNGWKIHNTQSEYDNVISFNIELRGLSPDYDRSTQKILRSNVLS